MDMMTRAESGPRALTLPNVYRPPSSAAARSAEQVVSARAVLGMDVSGRTRVSVLEGEIWVTGPGIGDEVLARGQSLVVCGAGRIVVQALTAARARIQRAE
jgi:hypothetical protein